MKVPTKLGAYAAVLAVAFTAGAGVGAAVGPLDDAGDAPDAHEMTSTTPEGGTDMPPAADLTVAGELAPRPLPAPSQHTTVVPAAATSADAHPEADGHGGH